jgi:hypothetical protein
VEEAEDTDAGLGHELIVLFPCDSYEQNGCIRNIRE